MCPRKDSQYIVMCAGVESGRPRVDSPDPRDPEVVERRATSTTATVEAPCPATAVWACASAHHLLHEQHNTQAFPGYQAITLGC